MVNSQPTKRPLHSVLTTALEAVLARAPQKGHAARHESRRSPLPHQHDAIGALSAELETADRVSAVMACGTGKTLIGMWLAERIAPRQVLVLVPSLALMKQTLDEWVAQNGWGGRMRYLCVCSDAKVADQAGAAAAPGRRRANANGAQDVLDDDILPADLGAPVTTNTDEIRTFLSQGSAEGSEPGVTVVFSTYQSAHLVGQAMQALPTAAPFDLGIFDEAHKTTGDVDGRFSFALDDANLPIKKRAFFTATPKHYKLGKRDKDGELAITSMDDEAVYGSVAYRLSFADAAARGLIVPYKIVVSVVDSAMVNAEMVEKGEVVVGGRVVDAKTVAHQLALKHAVEKYGLKRVITFHSTVAAAERFAGGGDTTLDASLQAHLPGFAPFHVSGRQNAKDRSERMKAFAAADRAFITNARCLTEGVDVPSVDMVAFIDPRKSQVDVAQAAGRAMRRSPGKECGYILVPLFIETRAGESLDQAVARSGFSDVVQVLNAMRESDEDLNVVISQAAAGLHSAGGDRIAEDVLDCKVEFLSGGALLDMTTIRGAVGTRLVEHLITAFDEFMAELREYKKAHGTANVPITQGRLGARLSETRKLYRDGRLSPDKITQLITLDISWSPHDAAWDEFFAELKAFWEKHGHCDVPQNQKRLSSRLNRYRKKYREGTLSQERINLLNMLGISWSPHDAAWNEFIEDLAEYKTVHGNCDVPGSHGSLGVRLQGCRQRWRQGKLSQERIELLIQMGVALNPREVVWNNFIAELSAFGDKFGHFNVPKSHGSSSLHGYLQRYRQGKLSQDQADQLNALGVNRSLGQGDKRLYNAGPSTQKGEGGVHPGEFDASENPRERMR